MNSFSEFFIYFFEVKLLGEKISQKSFLHYGIVDNKKLRE